MARSKRSWLEGPEVPAQNDGAELSQYPGERIGLSQHGPGSQSTIMRRVGGIMIDWMIACALSGVLFIVLRPEIPVRDGVPADPALVWGSFTSTYSLLIFFVLGVVSVWLFARTPGQAFLGMGVARIDDPQQRVGLWRACVRTLLTVFLLPAVIFDSDLRGMHDRATGTAVIRTR